MPIKGLTEKTILPRLGKIRTGIKKISQKGMEYPEEVPYFVLNAIEEVLDKNGNAIGTQENPHIRELIKMYGDQPLELKVVFPIDDDDSVFGHYMKWWGGNPGKGKAQLLCKGDGDFADYTGKDTVSGLNPPDAPCGKNRICNPALCPQAQPQGKFGQPLCKPNMNLMFVVPEYSYFGVFQMDTTSFQAIKNVVSCVAVARNALRLEGINTIAGIPMRLFRKRTPNKFGGVNYILTLEVDRAELEVQKRYYLDKKASTLGLAVENFHIDHQLLDEPNYDLLPKSEYPEHIQTGEVKHLLPPVIIDRSDWIDEEIKTLFEKLAELKQTPLTEAKIIATLKKHESKESLIEYLKGQLGTDV